MVLWTMELHNMAFVGGPVLPKDFFGKAQLKVVIFLNSCCQLICS